MSQKQITDTVSTTLASPQTDVIIDVRNLVKSYHHKTVVNDVSFTVRRAEIFGLLGPNGAGKTTTLEMIEAIRTSNTGTAILAGLDIRKQKHAIQRLIGVQLQATTLFPELTLLETLRFFGSLYPRALDPRRLLKELALEDKAQAHPQDLSGGQRQRLAMAIALVNDPQILFLDEPTAALDPQSRRMLWDSVLRLRAQGKTIILTTHFMDEAQILCDRIAIMDAGHIIALDTPAGLIGRLGAQATIDCRLDRNTVKSDIEELTGVTAIRQTNERYLIYTNSMQSTLVALLDYAYAKGITLTDLQVRTTTLEDVFLELTGRELRGE
jgi:ABC-2 type transport system ATP-binding protein